MITEDYVSFEVAKLLKEKGFNIECNTAYYNGSLIDYTLYGFCDCELVNCPTHQMAMKWLRDKWLLHVEVYVRPFEKGRELTDKWFYDFCIKNPRTFTVEGQGETYLTYEEAVETALKYALENLI